MGFRALYPAATKFKYIMQTIAKLLDEIPFTALPDGLEVRTLSPDKTTMIILRMPSTSFEEYELDEDRKVFVLPADELNKAAKRGTRNDMVEMVLEEDKHRLRLTFIDKKTSVQRTFYIPLREAVVEELGEPQVELSVEARMLTDDFKAIINDAKLVGDEVEFTTYEDRIEVKCHSAQKEYQAIFQVGSPLVSLDVRGTPPIRSKYAIDLLKASLKATQTAESVVLEYGESLPMKLTFELPGGSTLVYWVSPRV